MQNYRDASYLQAVNLVQCVLQRFGGAGYSLIPHFVILAFSTSFYFLKESESFQISR